MAPELALPPFVVPQPGGSDPMVTFARYAMVDDEGAEISAEAAAQRLVQVFRDIRPAKTGTGEQGQGQRPSGVVIDVNVELEGLRGTPVFLRWSLLNQDGEQQLLGSWLRSVVAQRLVATSEKDTAAVEVWVPLPARSGSYVVRLELTTKNQGEAPLAAILTEPFE